MDESKGSSEQGMHWKVPVSDKLRKLIMKQVPRQVGQVMSSQKVLKKNSPRGIQFLPYQCRYGKQLPLGGITESPVENLQYILLHTQP